MLLAVGLTTPSLTTGLGVLVVLVLIITSDALVSLAGSLALFFMPFDNLIYMPSVTILFCNCSMRPGSTFISFNFWAHSLIWPFICVTSLKRFVCNDFVDFFCSFFFCSSRFSSAYRFNSSSFGYDGPYSTLDCCCYSTPTGSWLFKEARFVSEDTGRLLEERTISEFTFDITLGTWDD